MNALVRFCLCAYMRLRWHLWRGKVCPATGKRCKAVWCNSFEGQCYIEHARKSNNSLDRPAASAGTVGGVVGKGAS